MKFLRYNQIKVVLPISCVIFLMTLSVLLAQVSSADVTRLEIQDCSKCHPFEDKTLALHGGKHATSIGCLDCHPQHSPHNNESRISCIDCHQGQPHFQVGNCLHCHTGPHQPLASLRDPLKPVRKECLSCHSEVGQQMESSPSQHSKLFCNRCHSSHKGIPNCLDCHEPHRSGQTIEDCAKCHPAHQPLKIEPTGYVPATLCRPCHRNQANALAETTSHHSGINCIYCHRGQHPSVPNCQDCHGLPHNQSIHSQFRDCLECHVDAHRLMSNQ